MSIDRTLYTLVGEGQEVELNIRVRARIVRLTTNDVRLNALVSLTPWADGTAREVWLGEDEIVEIQP